MIVHSFDLIPIHANISTLDRLIYVTKNEIKNNLKLIMISLGWNYITQYLTNEV